jgi:hypothetical protein
MKYLIDSNVFVTPHRTFAPIDVAVSLWNKVHDYANGGIICSIDKVKDELYENDDELKQWLVANVPSNFFISIADADSLHQLQKITMWASVHKKYSEKAKQKFMRFDKADVYLAAVATAHPAEYTVVSFEQTNHFGISEIKLPDVCSNFNAKCIPLEQMFRELKDTY